MSLVAVRQALETAVDSITPSIETVWENTPFIPTEGVEYQMVFLKRTIENPTRGSDHYRDEGFVQVDLMYPLERGTIFSELRTELILDKFKRGSVFAKDGINVHIDKTLELTASFPEDDRFRTVIRIEYHADICG